MPQTTRRRRLAIGAAALVATLAVTGCGADTATGGRDAGAAPAPTHTGHGDATVPPTAPLRAGERFVELSMARPYAPEAPDGGADEYRCFLVDPKLSGREYLTGSQFLPRNVDLVHHAIFFRIGPDDAPEARALDERTAGDGWRCFGDSGVDNGAWVAHWAPGADEVLLRPGLGHPMPKGSLLVMQVHYNLLAGTPGDTDQSRIRLRLTAGSGAMTALDTIPVAAPIELPCTAAESGELCDRDAAVADVAHRFGAEAGQAADRLNRVCNGGRPPKPGPTQACDLPVGRDVTVHAVAGHMHLLGRAIKIELAPETPRARTLLDIPAYDFDDQAIRPLDEPVRLRGGDTIRVTCTHDAGLRAKLPQLDKLPPRYVVWGDGTSDEMCLGLLVGAPA